MPSICYYLLDSDVDLLLDALGNDPDIAFIVNDGPSRWRCVERIGLERIGEVREGEVWLWHKPAGPLRHDFRMQSLGDTLRRGEVIESPQFGWTAARLPCDPGVEILTLQLRVAKGAEPLPLSHLGWVGNHYSVLGKTAAPVTTKWWSRFKRWADKSGDRISRIGHFQSTPPSGLAAYALPAAWAAIRGGRARSNN